MHPRAGLCLAPVVLLAVLGCALGGADHSASRTTRISVAGATILRLNVGAGYLRVEGSRGAKDIVVSGVGHAPSAQLLDAIQFATKRDGDTIFVSCLIPPSHDKDGGTASLDVELLVPPTVVLDVTDSTGESVFRHTGALRIVHGDGGLDVDSVAGNVDIRDGNGDMHVRSVTGNVHIIDGSGAIYLTDIAGSVAVPEAGSGEIQAVDISGDVAIGSKRSGEIAARGIGGNLSVTATGSGSIEYRDVSGRVTLPAVVYH